MSEYQSSQFNYERMTGSQKAALLILSLDMDTASAVLDSLTQEEIKQISSEIARLDRVNTKTADAVIDEFQKLIAGDGQSSGCENSLGKEEAERSTDTSSAAEIMERTRVISRRFRILDRVDPRALARFLEKEHPQIVSVILASMRPESASKTMLELSEDIRKDVASRMASLGKISPSLLAQIEDVIESLSPSEFSENAISVGGVASVAAILNRLPNAASQQLMEHMESVQPNLASEIKRSMFLFRDILLVNNRGIQKILREVDKRDLAVALKGADTDVKEKIYANMSGRAQELLKAELLYTGSQRVQNIQDAQTRIAEIIKQLVEAGEVVINRQFITEVSGDQLYP